MRKIIFLSLSRDFFRRKYMEYGVEVRSPYKKYNFINRRLAVLEKCILPDKYSYVYDSSIFDMDADIILFDGNATESMLRWLSANKRPGIRLFYWCWNPVRKNNLLSYTSDFILATYSHYDSSQYNIPCLDTFYFSDLKLPSENVDTDIFFLGGDKGRYDTLINLKQNLNQLGITTDFNIVKTNRNLFFDNDNREYSSPISYEENLQRIAKSNAILEILQDPTDGLSLRAMESVFFDKKLITNSKEIKEHPFFNSSNIFILGENDLKTLPLFLQMPYEPVPTNIKQHYEFGNWLNRILNLR